VIRFLWLLLATLFAETATDDTNDIDADTDDEQHDQDAEMIRDPLAKLKAREEQVARLAKKLSKKDAEIKARDKRIAELESISDGDALHAARLEGAFLRATITSDVLLSDLDTARALGHSKRVLRRDRGRRGRIDPGDGGCATQDRRPVPVARR
jgi:hypothetical protein